MVSRRQAPGQVKSVHATPLLVVIALLLCSASGRPVINTGRQLQQSGVQGSVTVDLLGIGKAIAGAISSAENRDGAVKNLCNTAYYAKGNGGKYNVMVFNLSQDYTQTFKGVKYYGSSKYGDVTYGVWAFEDGTFHNGGDGGYINWCFSGSFTRHGDQGHDVKFTKRS